MAAFKKGIPLLIVALALSLGCVREEKRPCDNCVIVAIEGSPTNLDPRYATDAYSTRIDPLVFSSLVTLDKNSNPICELCESYQALDPKTYVFKLKKGIKFSDSRPLTSRDVKYTFEFLKNPDNGCPSQGSYKVLESVETPDDYTATFRLSEPFAPFIYKLMAGIVPYGTKKDELPIGSGPYKLVEFRQGERVVLEKNPNYWGEMGRLDKIIFEIIQDDTTRTLALIKGKLDLVQNAVPPHAVKFLERDGRFKVIIERGINYSYMGFNMEDKILSHREVRWAIAHAIDRQKIIDYLLLGQARPASSIIAPAIWAYEPDVKKFEYNPKLSKQLLDMAGFYDPDGDGPKPRFALSYKTSTNKLRVAIATAIQDQLKDIGIKLEIRSLEWGTFFDDIKKGNFQTFTLTWVGIQDPDIFYYAFHSDSIPPNGANRGRYRNSLVDGLIEESRATLDFAARKRMFSDIQKILAYDCVYVSLWYNDNVIVMKNGLKGFEIYPGGEYTSLARARWE